MMAPLLARGRLPIDPRSLLHPISAWRQALLSLVGRGGLHTDPRYVNALDTRTGNPFNTIEEDASVLRFEAQEVGKR